MVYELVKYNIRDKPEKNSRYDMRPRKSNLSLDLNMPVIDEEYEHKANNIVKT
jgi:hypothetical protein